MYPPCTPSSPLCTPLLNLYIPPPPLLIYPLSLLLSPPTVSSPPPLFHFSIYPPSPITHILTHILSHTPTPNPPIPLHTNSHPLIPNHPPHKHTPETMVTIIIDPSPLPTLPTLRALPASRQGLEAVGPGPVHWRMCPVLSPV